MCDEDWVKVAMADDALVVRLLLRLSQPRPPPPPKKTLQLDWTVRQRRSRSAPRHLGAEKKGEPTRASPTTPLSWSGATSASGCGGDGYEESSRPTKPLERSRSKSAIRSETTTTKRSRRKKTLAELKEEESILLKERRDLKNELASLRVSVEKHRASNERLKRMKFDFESRQTFKRSKTCVTSEKAIIGQLQLVEAQCHPSSYSVVPDDSSSLVCQANASCKAQEEEISNQEASFWLPDLNLPVEEDSANKELDLH
ncbi:hypothetical protein L6164_004535 [Bauhinia variegata]|uniref:Uncharacterized protein n=1 Tax=Bauhinia variegata TaxID=167791 RepID=A0ACB9Q488_BAUVA|nr:hypothetical protein L6164_004535 [Bauhinia variegata]